MILDFTHFLGVSLFKYTSILELGYNLLFGSSPRATSPDLDWIGHAIQPGPFLDSADGNVMASAPCPGGDAFR